MSFDNSIPESRQLANRNRMGTGASSLMYGEQAPTHYIDTLERFQKDYAAYDKQKREQEKLRKQQEIQRKRIEQLERQNKRWLVMDEQEKRIKARQEQNSKCQMLGIKRTANSNCLAYNPINLQYEKNPEGDRLRYKDQDAKIRNYVRAHNIDSKGNCKYNPINGESRMGIDRVVPQSLSQRFENRLHDHYDNLKIKIPPTSETVRSQQNRNRYY